MAERTDLVIGGDVSEAEAAMARLSASVTSAQQDVAELADEFGEVERSAAAAADATDSVTRSMRQFESELQSVSQAEREAAAAAARASAERVQGFEDALDHARRYERGLAELEAQARETAAATSNVSAGRQGFASMATAIGSVVSGLESAVALAQQAVALGDEVADRAMQAQNLAATLAFPIDAAAAATGGLVEQTDLAIQANKAFALGVSTSSEDFAELAAGISAIAKKSGGDVTDLMEQAVEAVGKGSVERLDNVLILLDQAEAEAEYADALGITVDQLSDLQRASAIQEVALRRIKAEAEDTTAGAQSLAEQWKSGRISANDYVDELLGFDQTAAVVREALRSISEEDLERLNFAEFAGENSAIGREVNEFLGEWGVSLMDVKKAADLAGVSYEQLLQNAKDEKADVAARKQELALQGQAMALRQQAGEQEHVAALLRAQEADYAAISWAIQESIRLRIEAAEKEGDVAAAVQLTRQLQLEEAKAATEAAKPKRGRGRRRDPNEALDRETGAILRLIEARRTLRAAELEHVKDLDLAAARQFELIELEREALEVREAAAQQRKTRTADDRDEVEAELLEVRTQRRLLDLEVVKLVEAEEQRLFDERIAAMDREIAKLDQMGVATGLLKQQRAQAFVDEAVRRGEAEMQRDAEHSQQMLRMELERAAATQAAQERLDRHNRNTELLAARGIQVQDLALQRLELEAMLAEAEGDADARREALHQREVTRIKNRVAAQQKAVGQAQGFLQQGSQFASLIVDKAIKDDERREKAALKLRGIESLAVGGLEVVKAAAAFASFNYVEGALHTAAAALAFTQGALMIAGNPPGQGGASAPSAGAAGASAQGVGGVPEGQQARDLPSTPASAEELTRLRGGGVVAEAEAEGSAQGGAVVQIGTLVTSDTGNLFDEVNSEELRKFGAA